jgi:tRNA pseudouridine55 synthase
MNSSAYHGLLVFDKPAGLTSRDVVNRVQRCFPRGTRIGHAGTLDPLATGVLVLCVGSASRLIEYVQRMNKTYEASLLLGFRSDTDDVDGSVRPSGFTGPFPDQAKLAQCLQEFVGEIDQAPPVYSAVKRTGRRACDLARRGQPVSLEPRRVQVYEIALQAYDFPHLQIRVRCGKGTYIRALARDLGQRLGCGGLLQQLRRTQVGPFKVENALALEADPALGRASLLPPWSAAAELPEVHLDAASSVRLGHGQTIPCPSPPDPASVGCTESEVAVLDPAGNLVAIAVLDASQRLVPIKVMAG